MERSYVLRGRQHSLVVALRGSTSCFSHPILDDYLINALFGVVIGTLQRSNAVAVATPRSWAVHGALTSS